MKKEKSILRKLGRFFYNSLDLPSTFSIIKVLKLNNEARRKCELTIKNINKAEKEIVEKSKKIEELIKRLKYNPSSKKEEIEILKELQKIVNSL